MKQLLVVLLSFHMAFQASSIIHKAIPYIGNSGAQSATIHAVSGIKNVDLSKLASEYWNHLKTKEGDYYLYSLITDETLKHGNKRFGLTAEDVEQIKKFLLQFTMFNPTEYFAFSVLPVWLEEIYENKQNELIEKIDIIDEKSEFNFLKEKKVHLGVLDYAVQNYYQQQLGHKRYWYVKKTWKMNQVAIDAQVKDLKAIITTVEDKYTYIKNLETIENEDWSYDHVIIFQEDLRDEKKLDSLKKVLKERPDITVILAIKDDETTIANNFNINSDLAIKNLVITSRSLNQIGAFFLNGFENLISLQLPDGLTQVGGLFLKDCKAIMNLQLSDQLSVVGNSFLSDCEAITSLKLPSRLTKVGNAFLYNCSGLMSLDLPDKLTKISNSFLHECRGLIDLRLSNELTEIGDAFLQNCINLKSLQLPDKLVKVGDYFLAGCSSLINIHLPNALMTTGNYFLQNCKNLTSLQLPDGLKQTGYYFLAGCSGLMSLKLPNGLITISDYFLAGCIALKSLQLPNKLEQVGDNFLSRCTSLISLQLPDRLKQVGNDFLKGCSGFRSIQLPNRLTQVGNQFLSGCSGLHVIFMDKSLHTYLVNKNYVVPEIAGKIKYNSELITYQEFYNKLLNPLDWDYLLNNQEKWHIENCIYLQGHQLKLGEIEYLLKSFLKIEPKYEEIENKEQLMIILTKIASKNRYSLELMTYQEFKNKLLNSSDWDYLLDNQEKWHIGNHIYFQDNHLNLGKLEYLLKSFLKIKPNFEEIQNKKRLMIILTNFLAKLENK